MGTSHTLRREWLPGRRGEKFSCLPTPPDIPARAAPGWELRAVRLFGTNYPIPATYSARRSAVARTLHLGSFVRLSRCRRPRSFLALRSEKLEKAPRERCLPSQLPYPSTASFDFSSTNPAYISSGLMGAAIGPSSFLALRSRFDQPTPVAFLKVQRAPAGSHSAVGAADVGRARGKPKRWSAAASA